MLLDVVALQSSQDRMSATARAALPDAPLVPDDRAPERVSRIASLRLRVSLLLRVLADRIEPVPGCGAGSVAPSR